MEDSSGRRLMAELADLILLIPVMVMIVIITVFVIWK